MSTRMNTVVGVGSWNFCKPTTSAGQYAAKWGQTRILLQLQGYVDQFMFADGPESSQLFQTWLNPNELQIGMLWDDESRIIATHRLTGPFAGWSLLAID